MTKIKSFAPDALEIIEQYEAKTGKKIESHRLKYYIVSKIQRLMDENAAMKSRIQNVLDGHHTHNPRTHRPHRIPENR